MNTTKISRPKRKVRVDRDNSLTRGEAETMFRGLIEEYLGKIQDGFTDQYIRSRLDHVFEQQPPWDGPSILNEPGTVFSNFISTTSMSENGAVNMPRPYVGVAPTFVHDLIFNADYDMRTGEALPEGSPQLLAYSTDVRNDDLAANIILSTPGEDTRSEWKWFRLANGDLIFGCYPRGELYEATEADLSRP